MLIPCSRSVTVVDIWCMMTGLPNNYSMFFFLFHLHYKKVRLYCHLMHLVSIALHPGYYLCKPHFHIYAGFEVALIKEMN